MSESDSLSVDIVEAKRGVLEINPVAPQSKIEAVLLHIPHSRDNELIYLSRENADKAMAALRQAGLQVLSLEMEIKSLRPCIPRNLAKNYFGNYLIPDGLGFAPDEVSWKRYSFSSRCLLRAQPRQEQKGQWSLFLREGQPVVASDEGRSRGYYLPEGQALARCKSPQEMLEECHWQSLPVKIYFEAKPILAPYVALYHTFIWLPPKHYSLLYERLIGSASKVSGGFALIHHLDLPLVKQILDTLGIELVEGTPPDKTDAQALEIVEMAADAARLAYATYLKSEKGVQELELIGLERRWEQVDDVGFRQLLMSLSNRAYEFEPLAGELLAYLIDRLPRSFDWKHLRGTADSLIQGIVLDADISSGFGGETSKYYKVIVQELGMVLGVVTKRNLLYGEGNIGKPEYFLSSNWRATPYAGRLKFTGASSSVATEWATGKEAAEAGYSYIYGIPSLEAQLARELYLAAFFLDRDAKYWRGHNELSRYFAGHGKLVEKMVADFDEPASLFQDIFGNFFYLKFGQSNYLEHQQFIQNTGVGSWKRFVAHSGLRSLLKTEGGFPAFDLSHGSMPRDAGHIEVVKAAILGLLRYYGKLAKGELWKKLQASQIKLSLVEESLKNLVTFARVAQSGEMLYYGYPFCSPEDRILLAELETMDSASLGARLFYAGLRAFLPMIHPLGYGSSLAKRDELDSGLEEYQRKKLSRCGQYASIVSSNNSHSLPESTLEGMKRYGVCVLRVHPWNMAYAVDIISHIRKALPTYEVNVQRKDVPQTYKGREVIETWLRIYSPDIITRLYFTERLRQSWGSKRARSNTRR